VVRNVAALSWQRAEDGAAESRHKELYHKRFIPFFRLLKLEFTTESSHSRRNSFGHQTAEVATAHETFLLGWKPEIARKRKTSWYPFLCL
jgi:hypothetical protein